jgi:hypothetical protein
MLTTWKGLLVLAALALLPVCRADEKSSPLDKLDPAKIPPEERVHSQPKEVVAVLGSERGPHWGSVFCVALSPDGKWLASGDERGAHLWDAATLREVE